MSRPINRMRPVHPGEILREDFLIPLNLSANALALGLHVPATRIHEIIKGGIKPLSPLVLHRIEIGPVSFLSRQAERDGPDDRQDAYPTSTSTAATEQTTLAVN